MEDLELKNFKVWEDNKEQQLKTFSFGGRPQRSGRAEALHRAVLRQLHDGGGGAGAGAAGGGAIHRIECRSGPADGGGELHELAADRAELHAAISTS